jgi:phage/plasmid primase-like uncharacterized protein
LTESLPKTLDTAYGLWREILPRFGVPATALNGKHQACPACGGKDRFRFTDRKGDGDYFCNGCGAGKGISLVAKVNGWSYPEAAKRIDEFLHRPPRQQGRIREPITVSNVHKLPSLPAQYEARRHAPRTNSAARRASQLFAEFGR